MQITGQYLSLAVSLQHRFFGEIDPHAGRFPKAVEEALFFLLLAPWEELGSIPGCELARFSKVALDTYR